MKTIAALVILIALNSCNTCIGVYRDCAQGVNWTKEKCNGSGN